MALTLLEAAKQMDGEDVRSTTIEVYAESTDLMRVLPFSEIQGNALRYNQESVLPGIGFRGLNEGYSESTGIINPVVENLTIAGGDLDVDKAIIKQMGNDSRASHVAMKVKALGHTISHKIIKGDSETDQKEFDGLQKRVTGNQLISDHTVTGAVLSLANLDAGIDAVDDPQYLLMSKAMRRLLTAASRVSTVGGAVTMEIDAFGRQITRYNGLPILAADGNGDLYATLGFNEAAAGGGTASTSIYVLSFGEGKLTGIQNGLPEVTDLGELQTKPSMRTRVEWYPGIAIWHPRAVARVYGVITGAVTA